MDSRTRREDRAIETTGVAARLVGLKDFVETAEAL